jgi:hypothetical protein
VVGAQPGDAVGGERVAGAGAPSLAGEDRGDLLVGVSLGELAHERDVSWSVHRVWLPVRCSATVWSVMVPPSPTGPQLGGVLLRGPVDGHDDVGDDRAQQLLAFAIAGAGRIEYLAQIGARPAAPGDLLAGERVRARGGHVGQVALGGTDCGQALLPFALECAGDEAVLRFASVELAAGAVGVDLRARAPARSSARARGAPSSLLDCAQRRFDPGRAQRLEHRVEHHPFDPPPADRLAALGAVELVAAHARVVGHERLAAVANLHSPAAAPAADEPLQQRPTLARGAAALAARRTPV